MVIVDAQGMPIAVSLAEASVHESQLVEATLATRLVPKMPICLVGDKAYDSDALDEKLRGLGVEFTSA